MVILSQLLLPQLLLQEVALLVLVLGPAALFTMMAHVHVSRIKVAVFPMQLFQHLMIAAAVAVAELAVLVVLSAVWHRQLVEVAEELIIVVLIITGLLFVLDQFILTLVALILVPPVGLLVGLLVEVVGVKQRRCFVLHSF